MFGNLLFRLDSVYDETIGAKVIKPRKIAPTDYFRLSDDKFVLINEMTNERVLLIDMSLSQNEYLGESDGDSLTGGVLRSVAVHEILRNITIQEWSNLNTRLKGILLGLVDAQKFVRDAASMQFTEDRTAQEFAALETSLKDAGENNYALMLNSLEVKLASIADATAGNSFSMFKKELENDIAIAILGQANTSELPANGGSRAALQVLNMIRADIHYSDMLRVQELINKLLLIDYRINVQPNAEVIPYSFEWVYEENQDNESNARIIEIVSRTGLKLQIEKSKLYMMLGLPMPTESDTDLIELVNSQTGIVI